MNNEAVPQRIGRAEREAAQVQLRGHLHTGKLTQSEFDEREANIRQARFQSDLDAHFVDLGGLTTWQTLPVGAAAGFPHQELAPADPPRPVPAEVDKPARPTPLAAKIAHIARAVVWPLAILVGLMTGIQMWHAIVGAVLVSVLTSAIINQFDNN